MYYSSGLAIIKSNKILLIKPKGTPEYGHYSIPKGRVEKGESLIEAAVRETFEETGLLIENKLIDRSKGHEVYYLNDGIITKGE